MKPSHTPPCPPPSPLFCLLSFQVLKCCRGPISRFPFRSVMHGVAWRGYERRWGGGFALSGLPSVLCPAQKHYNASASDLHLSGAPDAGAGQGTLVVVLCTKSECVPRTAQRLDNCRLNVQLHSSKRLCVHVCGRYDRLILPRLLSPEHMCLLHPTFFLWRCASTRRSRQAM